MIGAVIYRLRAQNNWHLPVDNGRLIHALLFDRIRKTSEELSAAIHERENKPFSISFLQPDKDREPVDNGWKTAWRILKGEALSFRVAAYDKQILSVLLSVKPGEIWHAGSLSLRVDYVDASGEDAGVVDENQLIGDILSVPPPREITFHFLSPVSFRSGEQEIIFPLPGHIFESLAVKWNAAGLGLSMDRAAVKSLAAHCPVTSWEGRSRRIYLDRERGINGFIGSCTIQTGGCREEDAQLLLLLAQFSNFSGVGRLTAQGLGQSRVRYTS